jgi:NAD(P)H-dependent FMN reductase
MLGLREAGSVDKTEVESLRKASLNEMPANALISVALSSTEPGVVEIGQLPFYNQDLERSIDPPRAMDCIPPAR